MFFKVVLQSSPKVSYLFPVSEEDALLTELPLPPEMNVWLVEDSRTFRLALEELFADFGEFNVSKSFGSFEELEPVLKKRKVDDEPSIVLMDIRLPGKNGIDATAEVKARFPNATVVMLTMHNKSDLIYESLRAGASGYLLKDAPFNEIVAAVKMASLGGMMMPAPIAGKVLNFFKSIDPKATYGLTGRELEVLQLMCDGKAHKAIAKHLTLSRNTVGNHIRNIYRKLHVNSAPQAVSKAIRERLV